MTKHKPPIKHLALCTDQHGNEAIYVDNRLARTSDTIFQHEIADTAGRAPVTIEHENVELPSNNQWPEDYSDLTIIPPPPTPDHDPAACAKAGDADWAERINTEANTGDPEGDHYQADQILLELIESQGYTETAAAFRKIHKWYA